MPQLGSIWIHTHFCARDVVCLLRKPNAISVSSSSVPRRAGGVFRCAERPGANLVAAPAPAPAGRGARLRSAARQLQVPAALHAPSAHQYPRLDGHERHRRVLQDLERPRADGHGRTRQCERRAHGRADPPALRSLFAAVASLLGQQPDRASRSAADRRIHRRPRRLLHHRYHQRKNHADPFRLVANGVGCATLRTGLLAGRRAHVGDQLDHQPDANRRCCVGPTRAGPSQHAASGHARPTGLHRARRSARF